jgi:hypothetical protein
MEVKTLMVLCTEILSSELMSCVINKIATWLQLISLRVHIYCNKAFIPTVEVLGEVIDHSSPLYTECSCL